LFIDNNNTAKTINPQPIILKIRGKYREKERGDTPPLLKRLLNLKSIKEEVPWIK